MHVCIKRIGHNWRSLELRRADRIEILGHERLQLCRPVGKVGEIEAGIGHDVRSQVKVVDTLDSNGVQCAALKQDSAPLDMRQTFHS